MQSWIVRGGVIALAGLLAGAAPAGAEPDDPLASAGPVTARKVRFPTYDKDGVLKNEIFGDTVLVEGNVLTIGNLRVEVYEEGKLVTSFWAESCRYDRAAGTLESDTPVRVVRSGMMMTGEGLSWKQGSTELVIRRNVRVLTIGGAEWFKVEKKK